MSANNIKSIGHLEYLKIVLEICVKIQSSGKGTVFFGLYGPINELWVRIHKGAWVSGVRASYEANVLLTEDTEDSNVNRDKRDAILRELYDILLTWGVISQTEQQAA